MKTFIKAIFLSLALAATAPLMAAPVDINTADASTLAESLNGIGMKKAQAIVAYREANGPFQSADQLVNVKGIGLATVEKNRSDLLIDTQASASKSK